jgi:probable rRNA maturation factor
MEVDVSFDKGFEGRLDAGWLKSIAESTLAAEKIEGDTEMGLVIAGQQRVRQLNKAYRGKDSPTDVLAFAMLSGPEGEAPFTVPPDGVRHLGEVIISYPQAVKQAEEQQHPIAREVAILIIHGTLHLLGYDHIKDKEAAKMRAREKEILESLKEILE